MDILQGIAKIRLMEKSKGELWTQVQKAPPSKQNSRSKGKGTTMGNNTPSLRPIQEEESSAPLLADASKNPFEILSTPPEISEQTNEDIKQQNLPSVGEKEIIEVGHPISPLGNSSPPSYVDMTRKKPPKNYGSSEDDTFERPSKIIVRKSKKETREEEAERKNMQGCQATIEMSIGRNTRTRPLKGGSNSIPCK